MFGDGIDERIDGAVSYTFSKITAFGRATVWPVFKAIEHYAIGKGQEYFANPDEFRKKLFFDARCNLDGVAIESLGKLGGNISVVVPQSQAQVTSMLNRLDEETKARNPYAAFKFFSGSSSMIISEVSDDAIHHRKQLARFLVPSRYVQPVMAEVKKILGSQAEFIIREAVFDIVRTVLIQGILGIDKLPATTYQAMKNYSSDVNLWTAFPMPGLFRFVPSLRKKRAAYGLFAQEILEGQFETIVAELGRGTQPESRNLILMTIVDLIRKDHVKLNEDEFSRLLKSLTPVQIRKYFDHDSVKVLPILLKAADNLADAITICLEKLSTARGAVIAAMREELDMAPPPLEGDNYSELLSLPLLDAWYKEVLRVAAPVVVPRYTTTGMTYNGITIPPNTTIFFDLQALNKGAKFWENPDDFSPSRFLKAKRLGASAIEEKDAHTLSQYPFLPFSAGKRICPAFKLTEYIFKTFIATAVRSFDLKYGGALDNDIIVIVTPIVPSSSEGHRFGHN